jgi:hypothetical protein
MTTPARDLDFIEMTIGKPMVACCTVCKQVFRAIPKGGERSDVLALRIRTEFDQHKCNEDASQVAARIVREATKD